MKKLHGDNDNDDDTSTPYTDGQHRVLESLWIKLEMTRKDSQRNPAIDAQARYRNNQNDRSIIRTDQRKEPSYITFNSPSLSKRTITRDWSPIGHCLGVPVRISRRDLEEVLSRTSTRLTDTRRKLLLAHRGQRPNDCLFSRLLASLPSCHFLRIRRFSRMENLLLLEEPRRTRRTVDTLRHGTASRRDEDVRERSIGSTKAYLVEKACWLCD